MRDNNGKTQLEDENPIFRLVWKNIAGKYLREIRKSDLSITKNMENNVYKS